MQRTVGPGQLAFSTLLNLPQNQPPEGSGVDISIWATAHLPLPLPNINLNLLSIDCCWVRGGVGGQLPRYWYWSRFCTRTVSCCGCTRYSISSNSRKFPESVHTMGRRRSFENAPRRIKCAVVSNILWYTNCYTIYDINCKNVPIAMYQRWQE